MRDRLITRYLRSREHPGKFRVVRWLGRTIVPDSGVVASVSHGLRLYLHPRDWIEYLLLCGVPYEPLTLEFLSANLRSGDAALLAGTNFGFHVAVAAQAVGSGGRVVGVEPQPGAMLRTKLNLELNRLLSRVELVEAALGGTAQLVRMAWSNAENAGAASLFDTGEGFRVPMLRLDSLCDLVGKRPFRLLLLDIQGCELEALRGLRDDRGPDLAVVELDPDFLRRTGISAGHVADRLAQSGYSLFDLSGRSNPDLLELPERNLIAVKDLIDVKWPAPMQSASSPEAALAGPPSGQPTSHGAEHEIREQARLL